MSCKICGAVIIVSSPSTGMVITSPTCNCGKIRNRLRKAGCPECGAHGTEIQMHKLEDTMVMICECGYRRIIQDEPVKMYSTHYDAIPSQFFEGTVLDVGCGDGHNQRASTNWHHISKCIEEKRYTGVDIVTQNTDYVAVTDIFDYYPEEPFATVLAIHVIEHIGIERWPELFDKLKSFVEPDGWLIIGAPYKGNKAEYANFQGPENQRHVVFDIDEALMSKYLGKVEFTKYIGPYAPAFLCYWLKVRE